MMIPEKEPAGQAIQRVMTRELEDWRDLAPGNHLKTMIDCPLKGCNLDKIEMKGLS